MQNQMIPISFETLLKECMESYHKENMILGVPFVSQEYMSPIGPAAGPHTQLAGNIVSAYAAGASYFELKTIQRLYGEALGIKKPCIYTGYEAYNTEWSSELSPKAAMEEYIKAYLLISMLSLEEAGKHNKKEPIPFSFIMSVGYDYNGICSPTVNSFIDGMKHASVTEEWLQDMECIKKHMEYFPHVTMQQVDNLSDVVSDIVTLSTMHGCPAEEIEKIASYLLEEKKCHTNIKLNPSLLGKDNIISIFEQIGYGDIQPDDVVLMHDITFDKAVAMIRRLEQKASFHKRRFGVKLTNTFPVKIQRGELEGDTMYMSGPPLFLCAINVARTLAEAFDGKISISFSGGADIYNILDILATGIYPITVSTLLLKPGGYKNLTAMNRKIGQYIEKADCIDLERLRELAKHVVEDSHYQKKQIKHFDTQEEYSPFCAKCHNCEDVCPNRANRRLQRNGKDIVIHISELCNECGNCAHFCIMGHIPYQEKATLEYIL